MKAHGDRRTHPADGTMGLPLLTLSETAFARNARTMFTYIGATGAALAPHAKTAMSVDLARRLLAEGAWGTTVADIRQAKVMLDAGLTRIILANQVGGKAGARRLAAMLAGRDGVDVTVFVDSEAVLTALADAWAERDDLPALGIAVEVGAGRAGLRQLADAVAVIDRVVADVQQGRLRLAGIAAYEAAAVLPGMDGDVALAAIGAVLELAGAALVAARRRAGPDAPLILSVGGSSYFDLVIARLQPVAAADGHCLLVLRSGAIFFHDHGLYARAMAAMAARTPDSPAGEFQPALRLWAEVLSRPEPGLVICGMGMRDVSFDQGFPLPLAVYRDGALRQQAPDWPIRKLNDQHAFLAVDAGADLLVGDVIAFGISHPCTCIDHWHELVGVDGDECIVAHYPTAFR